MQKSTEKSDGLHCEVALGDDDLDAASWQRSTQALEHLLSGDAKKSITRRIKIVIANDFVRYVLLPWSNQHLTNAEQLQFARTLLVERYGADNLQYDIAMDKQTFEAPVLAAAIDTELVFELKAVMQRHGLRMVSLTSALADVFRANRRPLRKLSSGWLVDIGDGRLTAAAFSEGVCVSVSNERCNTAGNVASALLPTLRRDAIKFPALFKGTIMIAAGNDVLAANQTEWPVVQLSGHTK